MKLNSRIRLLIVALLALTAVLPSAAAQTMYAPTLKVGGGFDSVGDGGLTVLPDGETYSNGKGVFLGGVESYGGFLQADVAFKYDGTQVGLFTGGGSSTAGSLLFNGVLFVTACTDWGSFAGPSSGMSAGLSIEDTFGYGARPQLSLIGTDAEGLRLHYDLANVTTADLYDESADSTLVVENSDGTHKANLSVEKLISGESLTVTKGVVVNNLEIKDWSAASTWAEIRHDDNDGSYLQFRNSGETNLASGTGTDLTLLPGNDAGDVTIFQAGTGNVLMPADLKVAGNDIDIGDAGGFSGVKFNPGTTTLDFWIDGVKVAHISSNGTYTDDVP